MAKKFTYTFTPGYALLPERRKLKTVEEEKHIAELMGNPKTIISWPRRFGKNTFIKKLLGKR